MRSDMFEVIIERPRGGWRAPRRGPLPRPDDESPKFESTSRRRGGSKHLNENLAPLKRFLRSQVGRPWDKVFSEICEGISVRSPVQKHVRDHVEGYVALHVVEKDGEPFEIGWGGLHALGSYRRDSFFVCPRTGLLRLVPLRRRRRERAKPLVRWIDHERALLPIDGLWFEVQLAQVKAAPVGEQYDVVLKRLVFPNEWGLREATYGRHDVYAIHKRQLSRRELRQARLVNGRDELPQR